MAEQRAKRAARLAPEPAAMAADLSALAAVQKSQIGLASGWVDRLAPAAPGASDPVAAMAAGKPAEAA